MKNWKDYVKFEQISPYTSEPSVFFMEKVEKDQPPAESQNFRFKFEVTGRPVPDSEFKYDQHQIGDAVEQAISEFPVFEVQEYPGESDVDRENWNHVQKKRVENKIAANSRRGAGNTWFGDCAFYFGGQSFDCPIVVYEREGKFALCKHPNFSSYGLKMVTV